MKHFSVAFASAVNAAILSCVQRRTLVFAVVALAWGRPLPAQAQRVSIDAALHTSDKPYIQTTGEATISTKPDQAVIEIGVVSQALNANAASTQNAKQTDTVLNDLKSLFGSGEKVRTTAYSVRPNVQYPKPGAAPTISGYIAINVVEVTLDDLTQVSKVIDTATQSGANVVQQLQYRLRNPNGVRAQALREAAEQAKLSAEAMAAGVGLKVVRVLSVEEVAPEEGFGTYKKVAPPPAPAGTVATPLEIGTIDVEVNVTLRVEVAQ
jgi:uncharacterized protein YggE